MKTVRKLSNALSSSASIFVFAVAYILLAFGSFNVFTTETPAITYYSHLIKIWGFVLIIAALFAKKIKFDWKFILICLFIVVFAVSCFVSKDYGGLFNNLKGTIWIILEGILLFGITRDKNDEIWVKRFLIIIIAITTVFAAISIYFAIVGYIYVPTLISKDLYFSGIAKGRLYGFYTDPNYGGIAASICIFSCFYVLRKKKLLNIILIALIVAIQMIYISLTGSRTTMVAFGVSLFLLIFLIVIKFSKNKNLLFNIIKSILCGVLASCVFCVTTLAIGYGYENIEPKILKMLGGPVSDAYQLFPREFANKVYEECGLKPIEIEDEKYTKFEIEQTTKNIFEAEHIGLMSRNENTDISNNRFDLWKNAIDIWKTSPIIGVGHNNILNYSKEFFPAGKMSIQNQRTSHNLIFDILAGHGIVGLLLFLAFLSLCVVSAFKILQKKGNFAYINISILISIMCLILVSSMFYPDILYVNTVESVVFWYILGSLRTNEILLKKDTKDG